jgi:glutathione S-transferase
LRPHQRRLHDRRLFLGDPERLQSHDRSRRAATSWQGQALEDFPHLKRWYEGIEKRPAVQKGLAVMEEEAKKNRSTDDKEFWHTLFGAKQYEKR